MLQRHFIAISRKRGTSPPARDDGFAGWDARHVAKLNGDALHKPRNTENHLQSLVLWRLRAICVFASLRSLVSHVKRDLCRTPRNHHKLFRYAVHGDLFRASLNSNIWILRVALGLWVCSAQATIDEASFYSNFTNTSFVNQTGQRFNPEQLMGKVALFNFIYTKCSNVCPAQTRQLLSVYQKLPQVYQDKITVISISLDSQYDKPSVLQQYIRDMKANYRQWQFLSGQYEDIKALQQKLFLFGNPSNPTHPKVKLELLKTKDKETVLQSHTTILWVVDKRGMLIQRYAASPIDTRRLENELKQIADL